MIEKIKYPFIIIIGFVLTFLTIAFLLFNPVLSNNEPVLVKGSDNYLITGNFAIDGTFPINNSRKIKLQNKDLILWGSWTGDPNHTGQLISPDFEAPKILSLFVSGYPNILGNALFVERVETHEKLRLNVDNPGETWNKLKWFLPSNWQGSRIRIVAVDESKLFWIGISSPLKASWLSLLSYQIPSIIILPIYIIHFLLFIIPGLLLAVFLTNRHQISSSFIAILTVGISSLIGYITFWIYFVNHSIGLVLSITLILASIVLIFVKRKDLLKLLTVDEISFPLWLTILVGIFYLSILYFVDLGVLPEVLAQIRLSHRLPPDNIIPKLFAEKLYNGHDPRHLIGDWLSSDRPPLQSGIILVQRPLMGLPGLPIGLHYQILSTIAQCSWIASIWALCRTVNLSGHRIALVLAFSIFSGFFLLNSVYVWPKLLAGALIVFTFTLILESLRASQPPSTISIILASAAAGLGMMAHSGVVFTLPAIALLVIRRQYFPGWRRVLIGLTIFALILAPWTGYQKFYNPPGNRLVKWHLAGVIDIDNRSFGQSLIDSYKNLSFAEIAKNKWENVKTLVGNPSLGMKSHNIRRTNEFFNLFKGLGVLNIGWLAFLIAIINRKHLDLWRLLKIIIGVGIISLIVWVLLMFGPGTTVIHAGSYATVIILFAGLGIGLTMLNNFLSYFCLSLQIILFSVTWIFTTPPTEPNMLNVAPNIPLIILAVLSFIAIAQVLAKLSHKIDLTQ